MVTLNAPRLAAATETETQDAPVPSHRESDRDRCRVSQRRTWIASGARFVDAELSEEAGDARRVVLDLAFRADGERRVLAAELSDGVIALDLPAEALDELVETLAVLQRRRSADRAPRARG